MLLLLTVQRDVRLHVAAAAADRISCFRILSAGVQSTQDVLD